MGDLLLFDVLLEHGLFPFLGLLLLGLHSVLQISMVLYVVDELALNKTVYYVGVDGRSEGRSVLLE